MLGQLQELSLLVRQKTTKLQGKVLSALVTLEVHGRDVVERLLDANVSKTTDFEWISQLRYYWEDTPADNEMKNWGGRNALGDKNMVIRMVQCSYPYGYEYLGASARLVVTPLTDRCYMTLMGALHIKLGGAPAGPAGTGKTESVKDLAKALAKQCVVFNCSDGLDYLAMAKFFKGLATAGAWACFDEFNRIDIEVLSVIAQQILTITNAIIQQKEWFEFEGTNVKLDSTFAVFITMNPGYAGRSELPDNLKALFRPVSIRARLSPFVTPTLLTLSLPPTLYLLPDGDDGPRLRSDRRDPPLLLRLRQIEAALPSSSPPSAYRPSSSRRRITTTWHARGQHRHQAAGINKKSDPDTDEDLHMLRAMRDSNLPKFLRDDILLFRAIIKDLFPGVQEPNVTYDALEKCLTRSSMRPACRSQRISPSSASSSMR